MEHSKMTAEEIAKVELYPEFKITDFDYGVKQEDCSPMLSQAYFEGKQVKDFFGEDAAEQARIWCLRKVGQVMDDM